MKTFQVKEGVAKGRVSGIEVAKAITVSITKKMAKNIAKEKGSRSRLLKRKEEDDVKTESDGGRAKVGLDSI